MDPITLLTNLHTICMKINEVYAGVKANEAQATRLRERVGLVGGVLKDLLARSKDKPPSKQMINNLNHLHELLKEIQIFLDGYLEKTSWFVRILNLGDNRTSFQEFTERLGQTVAGLNLSISAEHFLHKDDDDKAAAKDQAVIATNKQLIAELNRIKTMQKDALERGDSHFQALLEQGLRQGVDQSRLKEAVAAMHADLVAREQRLQQGVTAVDKRVVGLRQESKEQHDVVALQLSAIHKQLALLAVPVAEKPKIDPKLLIPLNALEIESMPLVKSGYGVVYRARHAGSWVTVKILERLTTEEEPRFYHEVEIMAHLRHPNIVQLYGAAVLENQAALVMEYAEQGTLLNYITQKTFSTEDQKKRMLEISAAVTYLHHQGILHRNLTADNILIDAHGAVKIAGFDMASGSQIGVYSIAISEQAVEWMAPEFFTLKAVLGSPADVYAMGLLFRMIATQKPPEKLPAQLWTEASHQAWILTMVPESLPTDLRTLILRCLSFSPSDRPPAATVWEQLETLDWRPPSPPAQAYYDEGTRLQNVKQYPEALQAFERAREKGLAKAATNLGFFSLMGLSCRQDKTKASRLFEEGIKAQHPRAMLNLAQMLAYGDGVERDLQRACDLCEQAMQLREPKASAFHAKFKAKLEAEATSMFTPKGGVG